MSQDAIYLIKIKTRDAENQLEALSQSGQIETISTNEIPEWQKRENLQRLDAMKKFPEETLNLETFMNILNEPDAD